ELVQQQSRDQRTMSVNEATLPPPLPPHGPPLIKTSMFAWFQRNLFDGVANTVATVIIGSLTALALWHLVNWGIVHAVWRPDLSACRALEHNGACWGVIAEKFRVIFFGRYPFEEQWR